jgi:hypothetical protein
MLAQTMIPRLGKRWSVAFGGFDLRQSGQSTFATHAVEKGVCVCVRPTDS